MTALNRKLLRDLWSVKGQALAIAASLVGLDFVVTGAIGFCPLYQKLGRGTARRHSTPLEEDHHASHA